MDEKLPRERKRPSAPEDGGLRAALLRVPAHIRITFFSALLWGFLIHGYILTNKLTNLDDVAQLLYAGYGSMSGRWLLPLAARLDGNFSMSWVIGIFSLLLLAASACLTVDLLGIRKPLRCIVASGLMVSFPTVASTFMYMFTADCYFLSLFFACLGAWLTVRRKYGCIAGTILLTLSMGIYQSYVCAAIALLAAVIVLGALAGRPVRELLRRCLRYAAVLAAAVLLYMYITKLAAPKTGLTSYMGISNMGKLSLSALPALVVGAYREYIDFFVHDFFNVHFSILVWAFALTGAAGLFLLVRTAVQNRLRAGNVVLLAVCTALYPLAADFIFVMAPEQKPHLLMLYGLCMFLLCPLALTEAAEPAEKAPSAPVRAGQWVVLLTLALTIYSYTLASNAAYLKSEITLSRAYAWSDRLLTEIQSSDQWTPKTPVVLLGTLHTPDDPDLAYLSAVRMTGVPNDMGEIVNTYSYLAYLKYYLGWDYPTLLSDSDAAKKLAAMPEVAKMPEYPTRGGMKLIDGMLVVKLGKTTG